MSSFEPKYQTLIDIYERSVEAFAEQPLFATKRDGKWRWMSYRVFGRRTDELRGGLVELGVGAGGVVGIIANNRPEWAVCAYATYGLGARYVPMYESQSAEDWEFILRDAGVQVVFVATETIRESVEAMKERLPDLGHIVQLGRGGAAKLAYEGVEGMGRAKPAPLVHPEPETIAGLIYTSGTTGKPKGVRLSHRNLASNVSAMHDVFPMSKDDRSLSFLPWAHSFGQTVELHGLFSMGASLAIAESVPKIIENLAEVQPTLLFSVPRIFNKIHDGVLKKVEAEGGLKEKLFHATLATARQRRELAEQRRTSGFVDFKYKVLDRLVASKVRARFGGRLKYAFSGGAAINEEVALFIDALGILVYEGYGLTETSPIATANWPGARKIGSVGKPIPGVRVEIDRSVTDDPKHGEIVIFGHNVMEGYHGLPAADAEVFVEHTEEGFVPTDAADPERGFRSGDMGYVDEDGFLYITGRLKEQYKLENGKYVVPSPLEEQLQLSGLVNQVFVFGDGRPYNVALVVPDTDALERWCTENGISERGEAANRHERVLSLFREEIDKHSRDFKQFEKIKKLEIIEEEFTVENGLLTPKMSVKRRKVIERWSEVLERLYAA